MTRFYFHNATDGTTGLPTSEQSSLTANQSSDAATTNRSMNTTIGAGMTGLNLTTATGTQNWYFTRFVSPPIFDTSISANTWTYNFAAWQIQGTANFPVNGTNKPVRVNAYVWRPSTSTKIGTILDGNTASTVDEGPSSATRGHQVTFTGSAVSGVQGFDVIIMEIWFIINGGAARQCTFYYDGTTVNTTDNATVTNHASFLETPQTLTLTGVTHFDRTANASFTIVDGITKQKQANRTAGDSFTVAAIVSRFKDAGRTVSETVTINAPVARVFSTVRSVSASFTIVANALGDKAFARSVSETFMIGSSVARLSRMRRTASNSFTIVANVTRLRRVTRTLDEIPAIADLVVKSFLRIRSVSNVLTVSTEISKDYTGHRTVNETIALSAVPARMLGANRIAIASTVVISGSVSRMKEAFRTASESLTIVGNVVRRKRAIRPISESLVIIDGSITRHLSATRIIDEVAAISASVEAHVVTLFEKVLNVSLTISANVARLRRVPRTINQTIAIVTTVITKLCRADEY